jgi:uncharacterized membrane protein HdeD (DUF308 family)
MHHLMARFWWILTLRGAFGILLGLASAGWIIYLNHGSADIFGLSLFLRPAALVATLILLLGAYALVDGLFAILLGAQDYGDGRRWWSLIVEGILSVGLGLLTWWRPNVTVLVLLYWIAAWALFTGLLEILQGFELNEYRDRRKPFLFAGLCSVAFGALVYGYRLGGETLLWLMGGYAFLFGIPLLRLGFRLRVFARKARAA